MMIYAKVTIVLLQALLFGCDKTNLQQKCFS
jgi:hypothetical protein